MIEPILRTFLVLALLTLAVPTAYLYLLALGAAQRPKPVVRRRKGPHTRFLIAIPAHDEASVIAATVRHLLNLDYPAARFSIHIVADHCSDQTAAVARQSGGTVHERHDGPRSGKGGALSWLFERVLSEDEWDAVVVFDADTRVAPDFLAIMDTRLAEGCQVIQGNHIIVNPGDGWFPALTWAMFLVDNRFQNFGRSNLGWSAKNMGDSICFRASVLQSLGWGQGLTEDYQLRKQLLLARIRIVYEPTAKGYGEAAQNWGQARAQRLRWLSGTRDANQQFTRRLLGEGIRQRNLALLDGVLQAAFPSYSTLTLIAALGLLITIALRGWLGQTLPSGLVVAWLALATLLFVYPFIGLLLEKAPPKAYAAILVGPLFILWRTWLVLTMRFHRRPIIWVRTAHGERG